MHATLSDPRESFARTRAAAGVRASAKGSLQRLIDEGGLHPVFQPLVDLRSGTVHGHEALIRGPADSPLHSPAALFSRAAAESIQMELEMRCVDLSLQHWVKAGRRGALFINLSADALIRSVDSVLPRMLAVASIVEAEGLVIELTEHDRATDFDALARAVRALNAIGVQVALDDFGNGYSNLRRWSQLAPRYVKLDKFFTSGLASNSANAEMIRAIVALAESFGTTLVAEGIETGDELRALRDLGVGFGQGYFLGRPARAMADQTSTDALEVLKVRRVTVFPGANQFARPSVLRQLALSKVPPVGLGATNEEVAALFQAQPELHAVAIADQSRPVALVNRREFTDHYARLYFREVHGRKPCIGHANRTPRIVDVDGDVSELLQILTSEDQRYLSEGFVVTEHGRYIGLGTGEQLVRAVTETRIEAARHANPLTFLPGNVPLSLHIERLLASGNGFVAAYADLNDFKPFNDHYGYWRGDEMIRCVARLLLAHCDGRQDFVGHVGGDDFIVLFQGQDWASRCRDIVAAFAAQSPEFYDAVDCEAGGIEAQDRQGMKRFFPFTSLSIGAVQVASGGTRSVEDIAAEAAHAKHAAKSTPTGIAQRRL